MVTFIDAYLAYRYARDILGLHYTVWPLSEMPRGSFLHYNSKNGSNSTAQKL